MTGRSIRRGALAVAAAAAVAFSGVVASAAPPYYPSSISASPDPLSAYVPQSTCLTGARPGTAALRDLLLGYYPGTRSLGIVRACGSGGTSEHKEGRAFDWGVLVTTPAEKAAADEFTGWLLSPDPWGNPYGGARRMGVMYMIWDRKIWGSYQAAEGWRTYTGANPHTDHVHFSMSWAGANCETSWWQATGCVGALPAPPAPATGWSVIVGANVDGAGGDELTFYRQSDGRFATYATMHRGLLTSQLSDFSISPTWTNVLSADLDGDGDDERLFYRRSDGRFVVYSGTSTGYLGSWMTDYFVNPGWTNVVAADLNGDGKDSLIFHRESDGAVAVYAGTATGRLGKRLRVYSVNPGWTTLLTADLNGNGRDALIFHRQSDGAVAVYAGNATGGLGSRLRVYNVNTGWTNVIAADLDGDRVDELLFYRQPTGGLAVYKVTSVGGLGPRLYP